VEADSPVTLWTLRRGTSTRECRAAFVGDRIEGQLLVNGRMSSLSGSPGKNILDGEAGQPMMGVNGLP
jgi:hypothetical protein